MATSIIKRGYVVALMVSAIVFALYSGAWSQDRERLIYYMSDGYVLNVALDDDAVQTYLEDVNEALQDDDQDPLISLNVGLLMIQDEYNVRDHSGKFLLPGKQFFAELFLLVMDPAAPVGMTILQVKSFISSYYTIDYLIEKGLLDTEHCASEIEVTHIAEQNVENIIKDYIKITEDRNKVQFKAEFIPPDPYGEPEEIPPGDPPVWESPVRVRFSYDPTRLFAISLSRAVYEPLVADVEFMLKIDLSDPNGETLVDEIFNSVKKKDVTKIRYTRQIIVIDEIIP